MKLTGFKEFVLSEARRMVRDPNKPLTTVNVMGWNVYFYDDDHEKFHHDKTRVLAKESQIRKIIDGITANYGTGEGLVHLADENLNTERGRNPTIDAILGSHGQEDINSLNPGEHKEVLEFITDGVLDSISTSISLESHALFKRLNFDELISRYTPSLDDTVEDIVKNAFRSAYTNLFDHLEKQLERYKNPNSYARQDGMTHNEMIRQVMPTIQKTLAAVQQAGIRNAHKVPIRVKLVNELPEISGSTERALGLQHSGSRRNMAKPATAYSARNQQSTQYVDVFVRKNENMKDFEGTLVHEIGHVIFNTSPDIQRAVEEMAYSMPAPSNYGSTNYVFRGKEEPSIHHKSGNEWFAEMFKTVVLGENHGFTKQQIMRFKQALAGVTNAPHPHAGITYRLGQTNPEYAFAGQPPKPKPKQTVSVQVPDNDELSFDFDTYRA